MSSFVQLYSVMQIPAFNETCITLQVGENCSRLIGNVAVYRVGFAMTVFHITLMILLLCVDDGSSCRAGLHNGYDNSSVNVAALHLLNIYYITEII